MLFLEQDVDHPVGQRQDRWWAAFNGTTAYLPMVMADSGHAVLGGAVDFYTVYKAMVDREMERAPGADLACTSSRAGNRLRFAGCITNHSGTTLSGTRNAASLQAIVYEDSPGGSTSRIVRAVVESALGSDLADGAASSFTLETPELTGVNWDNLHSIVLAEYRPGGSTGAFDMLQASVPYTPAPDVAVTGIFPHVAIGGGYTTLFRFVNTGGTAVAGQLVLTDRNGNLWPAPLSSSAGQAGTTSFIPISIAPGGTQLVTASGSGSSAMTGWAHVESAGGTLGGVATYYYAPGGSLQTIVGILPSTPVSSVTIPRDDDVAHDRYTGFAVANPGDQTLNIEVLEISADGTSVTPLTPIVLGPHSQRASFFFEDSRAARQFAGTAVLVEQTGARFAAVSLLLERGIYSAVPVLTGKAPGVGGP